MLRTFVRSIQSVNGFGRSDRRQCDELLSVTALLMVMEVDGCKRAYLRFKSIDDIRMSGKCSLELHCGGRLSSPCTAVP